MTDPTMYLNRGRPFSGKALQKALGAATGRVIGGRGIVVQNRGGESVVSLAGGQIIPRTLRGFHAQITFSLPIAGEHERNDYGWSQVTLPNENTWLVEPGANSWDDPGNEMARNIAEVGNTAGDVVYGVDDTDTIQVSIDVLAIRTGSIVFMHEIKSPDGVKHFWFEAANAISVNCLGGAAQPVPQGPQTEAVA